MEFDKQVFKLFKMNRSEFNSFDRNCQKVLQEIFEKGAKAGRTQMKNRIKSALKRINP